MPAMKRHALATLAAAALSVPAVAVLAQTDAEGSGSAVAAAFPALAGDLLRLLILVIVVESAMAALFGWRVYRVLASGRALKTPLMFAVGLGIVLLFDYDIVARIVAGVTGTEVPQDARWFSALLSALVVAGGSSGINTVFLRLNLRNPLPPVEPAPRLDADQAWLAIRIRRVEAVGEIQVALRETGAPPEWPLAGSVGDRGLGARLVEAFGLHGLRFPRSGGRVVPALRSIEVALVWKAEGDAAAVAHPVWTGSLAPRAVVDLEFTA
jgi:hypothetical protein